MGFNIENITLTSPSGTTLSMDGASNWMLVNASGVLTRPQTPYMRGQLTGLGNPYNASGGNMLVTADENVGSCWNNSTGAFTCPVTGYYLMTGGGIASPTSGYLYCMKNGVTQHYTHWNHSTNWHYTCLSCILTCAAGDALSYRLGSLTPGTAGFYGGGGHGMYSIALMA